MSGALAELVRVHRSGFHEGSHVGSLVITEPDGSVRVRYGDPDAAILPRSCAKPLQAAGMLDAGVDLAAAELAIAAGSHTGEPGHVDRVGHMLSRIGVAESELACPIAWPADPGAHAQAIRHGRRRRVFMECSGKHAAMLATCRARGWRTGDYVDPEHPLQQRIRSTIGRITGQQPSAVAVDGCGTPVFAVPLTALARGFGSLAVAPAAGAARAVADAMRTHPEMVAGTGELDTLLMRAVPGLIAKRGADGVHCVALADGTGIAVKIADGGLRAHLPLLVGALASLGVEVDPAVDLAGLHDRYSAVLTGGGRPVGSVDLAPALADLLASRKSRARWSTVRLPALMSAVN